MRWTNKFGVHPLFVKMIMEPTYDRGEAAFTASQLTAPLYQEKLKQEMWDHPDAECDVSMMLDALYGTAFHAGIEDYYKDNPDYIFEQRYYMDINGVKFGGQIDCYNKLTNTIVDLKLTKVYATQTKLKQSWEMQCNAQYYLLKANGEEPKFVEICAALKDFTWNNKKYKQDYPECASVTVPIPIMPKHKFLSLIENRLAERKSLSQVKLEDLPGCSDQEVWYRRGYTSKTGRVYKPQRVRCESYCEMASVCKPYQDWKEKEGI